MSARKSPANRANRIQPVYDDIPICWDGEIRGPTLPDNRQWSDQTRAWWQTIRKSAQAMAFQETDWLMMLDTARLHNILWSSFKVVDRDGEVHWMQVKPTEAASIAGEIRRRCESYGFTWADRRKYGIYITTPEQVAREAENTTRQSSSSASDYRKRLNGLA